MREGIVARRYAKSLVELALEAGKVDKLFADMTAIHEITGCVPHFVDGLSDERVSLAVRLDAAERIIKRLKLMKMTGDTIRLLMRRGRISVLPLIAKAVLSNLRARKRLTVASAQVADRSVANEVREKVEEIITRIVGVTVECEVDIDPTLMGGFVVEVGDMRFDSSIKGKLTRMKEEFFSEERGM